MEWGGRDWTDAAAPHLERGDAARLRPDPAGLQRLDDRPGDRAVRHQEQKERFLPQTANLDIWWSQGFSEPDAGSDLASLRTTAVRDGDDWVVNGQKTWTTLGQYGDWIFTLVRTDPDVKKQAGISMLLIDMTSPGVEVRPIELIDGGHEVNEVWFTTSASRREPRRRGQPGLDIAKFLLGNERVGVAPVGSTKRALAQAKEWPARPDGGGTCSTTR